MKKKSVLTAIAMMATVPFALAGDDLQVVEPVMTAPTSNDFSDGWEYELTPYLWGSGMEGTVRVGDLTAPIDLGFDDVLENLDGGLMFAFDARKERFGYFIEGLWVKVSDKTDTPGGAFSSAKVTVNEVILSGSMYYRAVDGPYTLDLLLERAMSILTRSLILARAGCLEEKLMAARIGLTR